MQVRLDGGQTVPTKQEEDAIIYSVVTCSDCFFYMYRRSTNGYNTVLC